MFRKLDSDSVWEPMESAVATAKVMYQNNLFRMLLPALAVLKKYHSHLWPC